MKALSLKQPWAELVVSGRKTLEIRTWRTKFRGEFFIHASHSIDKEGMVKFGFQNLPTGCIVGKAELVDVKEYQTKKEFDADISLHQVRLSNWDKKRYGFILANVQRIEPKPAKGQLNFFEVSRR